MGLHALCRCPQPRLTPARAAVGQLRSHANAGCRCFPAQPRRKRWHAMELRSRHRPRDKHLHEREHLQQRLWALGLAARLRRLVPPAQPACRPGRRAHAEERPSGRARPSGTRHLSGIHECHLLSGSRAAGRGKAARERADAPTNRGDGGGRPEEPGRRGADTCAGSGRQADADATGEPTGDGDAEAEGGDGLGGE